MLDIRMVNFAKKYKCTYSRYADDLTFSSNRKEFPEKIAIKKKDNEWISGKALKKEIEKVGFVINEQKTSLQHKSNRQIVTGLIVNEKVNIKREYYKRARSMCHALFQSNEFYIGDTSAHTSSEKPLEEPLERAPGNRKQLEGMLSFIEHIKRPHDNRTIQHRRNKPTAIVKLYRKFLFYKHFFSLNRPLIICEGKTDIVYLKCAIKQLEKEYSAFVQKTDGKWVFKVGFLNFSKTLKYIFAISEGSPGLKSLIDLYEKNMTGFKGTGKQYPVVIVIDSDSGSKQIDKLLKNKKLDPLDPFSLLFENLYIVHVPPREGFLETEVEDLFDGKTLETKIDGKTFNRTTKIDAKTEYGKITFAEKVIKANQDNINFEDFRELLNRIKGVTEDYNQKKSEKTT